MVERRSAPEHVVTHMRQEQPAARERMPMTLQRSIVQMVRRSALVAEALADEEVGIGRQRHQRIRPFRIARERQHAPGMLHAQAVARDRGRVLHVEWRHDDRPDLDGLTLRPLDIGQRKPERERAGSRKQHVQRAADSLFHPHRPRDHERPGAVRRKVRVHEQERNPGEMIPVEMRQHNGVYVTRLECLPAHGRKRRRPAVDEDVALG